MDKETERVKRSFPCRAAALCLAVLLLAASLPASAFAAEKNLSLDYCERESTLPYTLGDLAAARFAVYGLLGDEYRTPQKNTAKPLSRLDAVFLLRAAFGCPNNDLLNIPFKDVDEEHREAVSWAYTSGIVKGRSATEFGVYHVTEQAFLTMLLNALGFQRKFTYADAFTFAESVGLSRPLGISRTFSLGDAMLYLQQVLGMTASNGKSMRLRMHIPATMEDAPERKQVSFPSRITLSPASLEDAEAQIELATHYLPDFIEVQSGALSIRDIKALYAKFSAEEADGDVWYVNRIQDEYLYADIWELPTRYELTDEEIELYDATADDLKDRHTAGLLSDEAFSDEMDTLRITWLTGGEAVTLQFSYNEAWELACDVDDAFTCYEDETLSREADQFYTRYVAKARGPRDAVYKAKNAIVSSAHYAGTKGIKDGYVYYPMDSHSIVGFFNNGAIVCDGYAKVFQYLMHRAGVPCVVCYGSTISRENAENGETDHAWNKVQINGEWLNMDVCWADTGWPLTFDLKNNDHYASYRHWLVTHTGL